jgi:hypothetical protein
MMEPISNRDPGDETWWDMHAMGIPPHLRDDRIDRWGRNWPSEMELCPDCGQPDNCGDCDHTRISDEDRLTLIHGDEPAPDCTCDNEPYHLPGCARIAMVAQSKPYQLEAQDRDLAAIEWREVSS